MFFYKFSISGYELYDPRILCHDKEFTEEEFVSLIDRIALRFIPTEIEKEFEIRKRLYADDLNASDETFKWWDSKDDYFTHIKTNAAKPGELYFMSIFDQVVGVLIEEYNFSYLKYAADVDRDEYEVVGIVPPIL